MASRIVRFLKKETWSWALIGSLAAWIIICLISNKFTFESLNANLYTAAFVAMLSVAQMLVVTTGHGAMDLSVPGMVTLSAFLQMTVINGKSENVILGLVAIMATGILVGIINGCCVVFLKIPPMIATLAVNYILTSASLIINKAKGIQSLSQVQILSKLAVGKVFGIYAATILMVFLGILVWFVLQKTTYGRSLLCTGQNDLAAHYAGINTAKITILTYIFASIISAFVGMLISVRTSGAFLGMGDDYLMLTVGSVVLGGTLMSGGKSSVLGTITGAFFLTIIVTAMQIGRLSAGVQDMVQGAIIILIIIVATPSRRKTIQM